MSVAEGQQLLVTLSARVDKYERDLTRARERTRTNMKAMEKQAETTAAKIQKAMAGAVYSAGMSVRGQLGIFGAGIAGGMSVQKIAAAAKEYQSLQNALRVTGIEGKELDATMSRLFQIANRQGAAVGPLVGLYSKLSLAQKELGISSTQLEGFTEGIAVALRAGGVSAAQASGPLLQLSQALGGGIVRAEEFNSMLEGSPTILKTVALGLAEAGGSVAKLRQLVNDGTVSSRAFFDAFMAGMPALAEQANRATGTVDQGMNRVGNAFLAVVGKLDETTGASKNAAENLNGVANAIAGIPQYVDAAAAGLEKLNSWLNTAGNNPFWKKLGEFMGVDYSPEGIAKNLGYTPPGAGKGGIGSDRVAGGTTAEPATVTPVSLASYPTEPAKSSGGAGAGRGGGRSSQQTYLDVIEIANQRIAQLGVERQALGLTTDAAEALRLKEELLNRAKQAGIALSPAEQADLEAKAAQYGQLAGEMDRAAQAQGEISGLARDGIGGIVSDLMNGVSAADAFANALSKIADRLMNMALDSLFSGGSLFGGGGGGAGATGNILGTLLGSLFGMPAFAEGGAVQNRPKGRLRGPGTGKSDSILARVSRGEFVVNAASTAKNRAVLEAINAGASLPAFASGGSIGAAPVPRLPSVELSSSATEAAQPVVVTNNITVNGSAGTPEQNADLAKRMAREMEATMRGVIADEVSRAKRPGNSLNNRRY